MTPRIEDPGRLDPDRRGVFERLSRQVAHSSADSLYDAIPAAKKGKIVSVDVARFLVPEFRTWSGRVRHTPSTANPAGAYAHDRLIRELARSRRGARRLLITAGGAGSGKTSQLRSQTSIADLVFDNQFKDPARARQILRLAIANGWETEVVYVHRPFADVVRAVIDRSQRTGRWNFLAELPAAHAQAQRTLFTIRDEFRSTAHIHAIYNASEGMGDLPPGTRIPLDTLRPDGRYHLAEDEKNRSIIPEVLNQTIEEGIVCIQIARIIAKGLRWRPKG